MSSEQTLTLEVTPVASEKIQEFLESEKKTENHGLRIRVKPGGCSGFEYILELDEIRESDNQYGAEGGRVIIDEISLPYVSGSIVDYVDSINGSGFDISNPNVKSSCGCGNSFGT
jgi:iron-sulfur cluster assembly protein